MKKISNDDTFENYLGKFIDMNVNGTIRKFFVSNIDSGSITTNAGILYPDSFSILRESPEQECSVCSDVCYQNIPVIKLIFTNYVDNTSIPEYFGGPVSEYVNDYADDTFDLVLNGVVIGRINTRDYKSPKPSDLFDFRTYRRSEIWFIPNYTTNLSVSYEYASASNVSSYYSFSYGEINTLGLSSYNGNLFNKNSFNEIALVPVSCSNPTVCNEFTCLYNPPISSAFLTYPAVTLDVHKIILNENGTSALSCVSYNMFNFERESVDSFSSLGRVNLHTQNFYINKDSPGAVDLRFYNGSLSAGSIFQSISTSFFYFDPCEIVNPPFYSLDEQYYYVYNKPEGASNLYNVQFAYALPINSQSFTKEQPINNPAPPVLRKMIFFDSPSLEDKKTLYIGENRKYSPYSSQSFSPIIDNPGIFKTRSPFYPSTSAFNGVSPIDIATGFGAIYSDIFANDLFEGEFYCLENRTNLGQSVVYRQISAYVDMIGTTTYQHLSVGATFNL